MDYRMLKQSCDLEWLKDYLKDSRKVVLEEI